jgi:hypothetical protein
VCRQGKSRWLAQRISLGEKHNVDKKTQRPTNALGSVLAIEKTDERRLKVRCRKRGNRPDAPDGSEEKPAFPTLAETLMLWSAWAIFPI